MINKKWIGIIGLIIGVLFVIVDMLLITLIPPVQCGITTGNCPSHAIGTATVGFFALIPLSLLYLVLLEKKRRYATITLVISAIVVFLLISISTTRLAKELPLLSAWILLFIGSLYSLVKSRKGA